MTESDANVHDGPPDRPPTIVLAGIVLALIALNVLATWLYRFAGPPDDWLLALTWGVWVFEPILFGVWAALGGGSLVTRLPIAIPFLLMLFVAPGLNKASFADMERFEFIIMVLAGMAIFAVATMLFLAARWFTGLRIEAPAAAQIGDRCRVRFSMKYMLTLITVYAVLFGMATQLKFRTEPPPPSFIVFGPDFYIHVFALGGAIVSGILLPIIAVPLFVLRQQFSKRAAQFAVAFWLVVTVLAAPIFAFLAEESPLEVLQFTLLIQLGATFVGLLVALPMRWVGFRLVSDRTRKSLLSASCSVAAP